MKILLVSLSIILSCGAVSQQKCAIRGWTGDVRTQENIIGVSVKLFEADSFVIGATSNEHGEFGISNLPINDYRIEISHPGYKTSIKEPTINPGTTKYITTYLISSSDTLTSPDQISTDPGIIRGFVADSNTGEILPLVKVIVIKGDEIVGGVHSDFDGYYQITKLKPDSYELLFEYVGYQSKTVLIDRLEAGQMFSQKVNLVPDIAPELPAIVIEHHGSE